MQNEIGNNSAAIAAQEVPAPIGVAEASATSTCDSWYVLRYKILWSWTNECLTKSGFEFYFPTYSEKTTSLKTGQTRSVTKSVLPGYLFVHAPFNKVKELGKTLEFNLWKKSLRHALDVELNDDRQHAPESRLYHSISDSQMTYFKRAIELYKQGLFLSDSKAIDFEQDDHVIILSGEFKGVTGYLKTSQGKDGGLVIIPVSFDEDFAHSDDAKGNSFDKFKRNSTDELKHAMADGFCYAIKATADQIGVISFAGGNRHASDCIRMARQLVDKAMKLYASKTPLDEDVSKQLNRYICRFRDTQFKSDKLKANHLMLLYRIYTMQGNITLRDAVLEEIERDVLPAFDARIEDAQRRGRPDGRKLKEKYLAQKEQADKASLLWMEPDQEDIVTEQATTEAVVPDVTQ